MTRGSQAQENRVRLVIKGDLVIRNKFCNDRLNSGKAAGNWSEISGENLQ